MYEKRTLPNGVRMVYEHMPHVRSAAIGVWIGVGSRYASPSNAGSAHFIEHMLFKGTAQHTASELAERMEAAGRREHVFRDELSEISEENADQDETNEGA